MNDTATTNPAADVPAAGVSPSDEPIAYHNGRFVPLSGATLSVTDRGVVQGATLTETLRTFGGQLKFVEEHIDRLLRGADAMRMEIRVGRDELADVLLAVAERNAHCNWPDAVLVVVATPGPHPVHAAGVSALGPDAGPTLIVHARPVPKPRQGGWSLIAHSGYHGQGPGYPRDIKHRSRLNWYLAERAQPAGGEPLFVDEDGVVTETNSGNLLCVRDGRLLLSPVDRVLPGVTQATLATLAEQAGVPVERVAMSVPDVMACDEVFLSSSSYVLGPVVRIDGQATRTSAVGRPVFADLRKRFAALVGVDVVGEDVVGGDVVGGDDGVG